MVLIMPALLRFRLVAAVACATFTAIAESAPLEKPLPPELNRLVAERSARSQLRDGVLHLRQGGGWVRTRRIFGDFALSAEIRLTSPKTELSMGVRTINVDDEWPRRGYRLRISSVAPATLTASGYKMRQLQTASVTPSAGVWHEVTLIAKGPQLETLIDGAPAGTYSLEILAGSLLFEVAGDDAEV
jgi:hypothetical protein